MSNTLPNFDFPDCLTNLSGWGPAPVKEAPVLEQFDGLPYQPYNKCDRIGRIVDWLGMDRYKKSETRDRYNERLYGSSATAGVQFDYVHDNEDLNFQLVDSSRPQKPQKPMFRRQQFQFRKLAQREQERREYEKYNVPNKMKRSILKEQQKAYKVFLRRGGGTRGGLQQRSGARRYNDRQAGKGRQPSVQIRPTWDVIKELDFQSLNKLYLPTVEAGKDIEGHSYGTLHYYDKTADRVSASRPVPLQRFNASYYHVTTTDDPVIEKLASLNEGNVFATDIILATLMASTRSVNSWDLIAQRVGNKLFFDKRATSGVSPIDCLWVSETAMDPPSCDGPGINNAKTLSDEALFLNQNFRRQVFKRDGQVYKFENPKVPFEDEESGPTETAYKYRKWDLGKMSDGTPITLVARTEHDAVMQGSGGELLKLTVKAFNEWDSSQSGGEDWRSKLEIQRGTVLATEVRNNNCKVAKWTIQAVLAGSDLIKFGFVSRLNVKNSAQHLIFGTQQWEPNKFASSLPSLNMPVCWGILRAIIDFFMERPTGKYLLMKDPHQPVIRIYALPDDTFDSSDEEREASSEGECDD